MFKSVFSRLMFTYLLVAVISQLVLGAIFTQMLRNEYLEDTTKSVVSKSTDICSYVEDRFNGEIDDQKLMEQVGKKAREDNCVIWVVDSLGKIWIAQSGSDDELATIITDINMDGAMQEMYEQTQEGKVVRRVADDEALFDNTMITIATPLVVNGNITGAVFIHSQFAAISDSLSKVYSQVLFSTCISIAIAMVLVFITARQIQRPILELTRAETEMSKGNFKRRVKITSKDEVGRLGIAFNQMGEDLEKYESTRSSFVANVSHELKSPLTSMQGFLQGMLDGTIEQEKHPQYISMVLSETKRMSTLISDLLDLSKIESGKFPLNIKPFDINELIRRTIITFENKIEDKDLSVMINIGEDRQYVLGDEDRYAQVLTNLIDNAVKFSIPNGELKIWTQDLSDKIYVNVSNMGPMIPPEDLPYIFERFYKVDKSHNRKTEGTGIGLSIVKRIIKQHGETLSVSSDENCTCFTFSIRKQPQKHGGEKSQGKSGSKKLGEGKKTLESHGAREKPKKKNK